MGGRVYVPPNPAFIPPAGKPYPFGPPGGFINYYISVNGNDANNGLTPATAWSVTAINNKAATYAGKNVGMIGNSASAPTIYTQGINGASILSIYQAAVNANGQNRTGLTVNGGTSAATLTWLGAVNALGVYTPRCVAICGYDPITGNRMNGGTGGTGFGALIGQGFSNAANKGFVWIDGLVIYGGWQHLVAFYPQLQSASYPYIPANNPNNTNIIMSSCELADMQGYINNNMAAVLHQATAGLLLSNNRIHSIYGTIGSGGDCMGIVSFVAYGYTYEYNTIYDSLLCIYDKNQDDGGQTVRYNLLENAGTNLGGICYNDGTGGLSGDTFSFYGNICFSPGSPLSQKGIVAPPIPQTGNYRNNTFVTTGQQTGQNGYAVWEAYLSGPITYRDNIHVNLQLGTSVPTQMVVCPTSISLMDYNTWSTAQWGTVATPGNGSITTVSGLPAWQSATGQESHSTVGTDTFAGTMGIQVAANYKLVSGPSKGTGSAGGDRGAWGGPTPPSQIGCDFNESPLQIYLPNGLPGATHGTAYSSGLIPTSGGSYRHQLAITQILSGNAGNWATGGSATLPFVLSPQVITGTPPSAETFSCVLTLTDTWSNATTTFTATIVVA